MEFSALQIFLAVAQEGGVSKAAQKLNYVQSNVTARIRKLEEELGVSLFYRRPRGMSLTPAGELLLQYAQKVLRLMDEAQKAVTEQAEVGGKLNLGSLGSTAAVRLPGLLAAYYQQYPAVEINLATGRLHDLMNQVLEYKLDGAFVTGPVNRPELVQQEAFWEELVLVTQAGTGPPPHEQYRNALVCPQGQCHYRTRMEYWLREEGLVPYRTMEFDTPEAILGCVATGMGVSMLPRSVVEVSAYKANLAAHDLPPELAWISIVFIRRKDGLNTKAMEALCGLMAQRLNQPGWRPPKNKTTLAPEDKCA